MLKQKPSYLLNMSKQASSSDFSRFPLMQEFIVKRASELQSGQIRQKQDRPAVAAMKTRLRQDPVYVRKMGPLLAPKTHEIDNRGYAQAPYSNPLNFDQLNRERAAKGNLLAVPVRTNVLSDIYNIGGASVHGAPRNYGSILPKNEAAIFDGKNLHDRTPYKDQYYNRVVGYDKDFSASEMSGLSHELNHANNWPTIQERESIRKYQASHPGFSNDVYNYKPSEGIQAISSLKRVEAERATKQGLPPYEINTPGQLEGALARLVEVDPYTPASADLNGEEKRLRNQMRSSIEDYNRRNKLQINYTQATRPDLYTKKPMVEVEQKERAKAGIPPVQLDEYGKGLPAETMMPKQYGMKETRIGLNNPILPTTSTPYQPGTWAGHPVVRNIARTYGKTVPYIVKDENGSNPVAQQLPVQAPQAPQPPTPPAPALAKQSSSVASAFSASCKCLMGEELMSKIASGWCAPYTCAQMLGLSRIFS